MSSLVSQEVTDNSEIPSGSVTELPTASAMSNITCTAISGTALDKTASNMELKDQFCDPENPIVVKFEDVSAAAYKIRNGIEKTPCSKSKLSRLADMELFFKKEVMQHTGSFKERGARYTLMMLPEEQKKRGVIAASAGNHALALAYHGKDLNIPVTVIMPKVAPLMKVSQCRLYGADVVVKGVHIGESKHIAMSLAIEKGLQYINGYDHPHILAGQGTMGLEIVEQVSDIDAIAIPVGGGGLIAGTAVAIKSLHPKIKIYGVEAENCPTLTAALNAGKPVPVEPSPTLADGLAVPLIGVNAFATVKPLIDKMITVTEEEIAIAILRLVEFDKIIVEGAGAAALAAALSGKLDDLKGKRVVIPLCGGNIDTTILGRTLERGLAADGRLCRFTVHVTDRPGGIAELTRMIASLGISLKDIFHERAWVISDVFTVRVKCVVETRDRENANELEALLHSKYRNVYFGCKSEPDPEESIPRR